MESTKIFIYINRITPTNQMGHLERFRNREKRKTKFISSGTLFLHLFVFNITESVLLYITEKICGIKMHIGCPKNYLCVCAKKNLF
jgi:hypothetical protein